MTTKVAEQPGNEYTPGAMQEDPAIVGSDYEDLLSGGGRVPHGLVDANRDIARPQQVSGVTFPRGPILQGSGPTFSATRFADEMRSRLEGNAKGWAFAITTGGNLAAEDADGQARTPEDDPDGEQALDMTPGRRLNIASVSKTITAVAVLRLLEANGLTTDDAIWPYLPEDWTLGPNVTDLSFRDLLTHRSGLTSMNSNFSTTLSYDGLATAIQTGSTGSPDRLYLNANYALFRVIIAALWREALGVSGQDETGPAAALLYVTYIRDELFGRMNGAIGDNASTGVLDTNPTRYYNATASTTGVSYGNWALIAGGGGWHLSARELAAFLTNITYNDDVLSPAARSEMDTLALGWRPLNLTTGRFGQYRAHGGAIGGGGGRVRTAIAKFSIECEAALVANSAIDGFSDPVTLVTQAFDAAWE